jgi:hypothetical protein
MLQRFQKITTTTLSTATAVCLNGHQNNELTGEQSSNAMDDQRTHRSVVLQLFSGQLQKLTLTKTRVMLQLQRL